MSHFTLTRPLGWDFLSVFASAEAEDLDAKTAKSLNADEGGTWNNTSLITFGGSAGWRITAPSRFDAMEATVPSGKILTLASGSLLAAANGSAIAVGESGLLSLAGTVWPTLAARDHYTWEDPRLLGYDTSFLADLPTSGPRPTAEVDNLPSLYVPQSAVTGVLTIGLPKGPQNASLVAAYVLSRGHGSDDGVLVYPKYRVFATTLGTPSASADIAGTTALSPDVTHDSSGAWDDWVCNVITLNSPTVYNPAQASYRIRVTRPYNATDPAGIKIHQVGALYSLTSLRP